MTQTNKTAKMILLPKLKIGGKETRETNHKENESYVETKTAVKAGGKKVIEI